MGWTTADISSQVGRVAVVTGANTGLGFETAAGLAGAGATVVLVCRDETKAHMAKIAIESRRPGASVETVRLDLGDLGAVADGAAETRERFPSVDLLINNAGVMAPPRTTTADGFELQFGINHLGHFAYTGQVLGSLLATPGSRIVTVSSLAHAGGRMRWDDLGWERSYRRFGAYAQSKLANLLFTFELQRRLDAAGAAPVALAAHPGVSSTELVRFVPGADLPVVGPYIASVVGPMIGAVMSVVLQPAAAGALPTLRAATDPEAGGAQYYGPHGRGEVRGSPVLVFPRSHAVRAEDMSRLWSVSEALTGVHYLS